MRLSQIVYNLVGNALKFTGPGGQVVLSVSNAAPPAGAGDEGKPADADERRWLRLAVSDTGCGIHPENLARVFDSFEQEDDQVTRLHGGTGLGLAITKALVELMGGTIGVESEVGKGSTFTVDVPSAWARTGRNAHAAEATRQPPRRWETAVRGRPRRRILFCERPRGRANTRVLRRAASRKHPARRPSL